MAHAQEQSRKRGTNEDVIRGVLMELAEEVDEKCRQALKKLLAEVENDVVQVEGIMETITRKYADKKDVSNKLQEKVLKKLHLISSDEDIGVGSSEDRGVNAANDSLHTAEEENHASRLERFKIKTINVGGIVKEGEDKTITE